MIPAAAAGLVAFGRMERRTAPQLWRPIWPDGVGGGCDAGRLAAPGVLHRSIGHGVAAAGGAGRPGGVPCRRWPGGRDGGGGGSAGRDGDGGGAGVRPGGRWCWRNRPSRTAALAWWGQALAGFCREAAPVVRVAWHRHHPHRPASATRDADPTEGASDGCRAPTGALVEQAAPIAMGHEVLVAVTVDRRRPSGAAVAATVRAAAVEALAGSCARFTDRLRHARLAVSAPLSGVELVTAVALSVRSGRRRRSSARCAAACRRRRATRHPGSGRWR